MTMTVEDWGFATSDSGELIIGGARAQSLADEFGTPLHVVDEVGLRERALQLRSAFERAYPGSVGVYFALKANNTPGIVQMVLDAGIRPEVGTLYEWTLVRHLNVPAKHVMINGPFKGPLLVEAVEYGVGLIVVDGPYELEQLEHLCSQQQRQVRVLIRINPDCVPRGMNRASATGSRTHSVFGFDLKSGEVHRALQRIARSKWIRLAGLHCHVGTGIQTPRDYERPVRIMVDCAVAARRAGLRVEVLDIGGGFGVPTSRELDTIEFLRYQALGHLPAPPNPAKFPSLEDFATGIARAITRRCRSSGVPLPRLLLEPGRAIVSGADVLLVRVGAVKERPGVGTWVITDGAAGTVAFPLFYEYHEVFLCRAVGANRTLPYTIVGPVCFSADWIYRRKRMPEIRPGDVLAVCDAGAYFTVQESNFGFPRPPIVSVRLGKATTLRRRETYEDMVRRDFGFGASHAKSEQQGRVSSARGFGP